MFSSITFLRDCRGFAKDSVVELLPGVNLIVGDQGCGKSTLLSALEGYVKSRGGKRDFSVHMDFDGAATAVWKGPIGRYGHFDFEKGNPRTQPGFGMDERITDGFQIAAMFASHGQSINAILHALSSKVGPNVLSFDEPDMALSPRSIYSLIENLKANVEPDSQVLMSAHNPDLIRAFPLVLSLEHGRWMPSTEFLTSHQKDPAPTYPRKPRKVTISCPQESPSCPATESSAGTAPSPARPKRKSKKP